MWLCFDIISFALGGVTVKKYIVSYGTALLISLVGLVFGMLYPSNTIIVILAVLSILPILLLIANILLSKQYIEKIRRAKVADMQAYMLRHRAEAQTTATVLLRKLQRMRRTTAIYAIFLWCLAACPALLGGMLYGLTSAGIYIGALYSGTIFFAVYTRIRKKDPIILNENSLVLSREEYPHIYSAATRAADTLNCRGSITILLTFDCNASIVRDGNKYYLQLGVILLNLLSEEELYCICLHEFSHYSAKNEASEREKQYNAWITSSKNISTLMLFLTNLFVFFDVRYLFDHMTYSYATSVVTETEADRDMAKYGSPEVAASALLKINYDDKFRWEEGVTNEPTPYASEEPTSNYISERLERFKSAIKDRHEVWSEMLAREILPNNASHPTLKMRLETLGVDKINYVEYDISADYKNETQKALKLADKRLCDMQDSYEADRKECYLEPLERITEWKNNGMPISAETYADIITDMKNIGLHEEAEALCERAIQELDENSSQHAYFIKGCALLYRYDESGMDLVYHAIETNHNYLEEGLQIIGEFCCITGREKELLEYRERAQKFAQKDKDEYSETGFLSKDDKLSRDDMPREMLEEILAYIKSVDGDIIENIYLVRKTISDSFFTSAFVIHFYGGTDAQRDEIMHKIFRYLDTYPVEWHFSLFDYFEFPQVKIDKIEGSLVYSKSKNKGE